MNALYSRLAAADEARDAAALAALAWQIYGLLATTAADLYALRVRFRVYADGPHGSNRQQATGNSGSSRELSHCQVLI